MKSTIEPRVGVRAFRHFPTKLLKPQPLWRKLAVSQSCHTVKWLFVVSTRTNTNAGCPRAITNQVKPYGIPSSERSKPCGNHCQCVRPKGGFVGTRLDYRWSWNNHSGWMSLKSAPKVKLRKESVKVVNHINEANSVLDSYTPILQGEENGLV